MVVADSSFVNHDATREHREAIYRPLTLPPPYDEPYLKVVVEFHDSDQNYTFFGTVVLAFLTRRVRSGEKRKWP